MSINTAMTAIADKIRALLGLSGAMGLNQMSENLGTVQTDISDAYAAVSSAGGTVPESKTSGNLASAIETIPSGVTVQRKTGAFTTDSNGYATVNCGFQPDFVYLQCNIDEENFVYSTAMAFAEETRSGTLCTAIWSDDQSQYAVYDYAWTRFETGFNVSASKWSFGWAESALANKQYNYVAVKYTS